MKRFRITAQAKVDVLEIWHRIAQDSIDAANRVGADLDAALRQVAQIPRDRKAKSDARRRVRLLASSATPQPPRKYR